MLSAVGASTSTVSMAVEEVCRCSKKGEVESSTIDGEGSCLFCWQDLSAANGGVCRSWGVTSASSSVFTDFYIHSKNKQKEIVHVDCI